MAKSLSVAQVKEREELEAFLNFFSTHIRGILLADPVHPQNVGLGILARYGALKAFTGLKQAINDVIEATRPWSAEKVVAFNTECAARGVLTLSELRRRYSGRYKSIVQRGRLRSDTEYYLVMGVLADVSQEESDSERQQLQQMVSEYESRK